MSYLVLFRFGNINVRHFSKHFSTPVNISKNSILNQAIKLNLFYVFFFTFLFCKNPWKIFHSIHFSISK